MQDHKPVHHKAPISSQDLPPIPERRYFTIGEVAKLCAVKPHVLRYWEQEFPQLKPSKRRGNRRYYQFKDVKMIRTIYHLLYDKGFTISGARQHIKQSGLKEIAPAPASYVPAVEGSSSSESRSTDPTSTIDAQLQPLQSLTETPKSPSSQALSSVDLTPIIEELEEVLLDLERVAF